jgi:prostaglandin-H2 D-isomerase / glutathione transferase
MTQLRLTYFDSPGRAEPLRIALFVAGVPFEDRRLKFPEYGALREQGAFPLGSVPVLEVDGRTMTQTASMLRFVARLSGKLYPADARAAFVVDSVIDTFNDTVSHALTPSLFERDPAKKLEMRRALVAGPLKLALRYVEGLIEGPFLVGSELTIGDILLGYTVQQYSSGVLDGMGPEILEDYPRLRALGAAYAAHPSIVAYANRNAAA